MLKAVLLRFEVKQREKEKTLRRPRETDRLVDGKNREFFLHFLVGLHIPERKKMAQASEAQVHILNDEEEDELNSLLMQTHNLIPEDDPYFEMNEEEERAFDDFLYSQGIMPDDDSDEYDEYPAQGNYGNYGNYGNFGNYAVPRHDGYGSNITHQPYPTAPQQGATYYSIETGTADLSLQPLAFTPSRMRIHAQ